MLLQEDFDGDKHVNVNITNSRPFYKRDQLGNLGELSWRFIYIFVIWCKSKRQSVVKSIDKTENKGDERKLVSVVVVHRFFVCWLCNFDSRDFFTKNVCNSSFLSRNIICVSFSTRSVYDLLFLSLFAGISAFLLYVDFSFSFWFYCGGSLFFFKFVFRFEERK